MLVNNESGVRKSSDTVVPLGSYEPIVVLYAEAFPPETGGGERYNFELAKGINDAGINISVVTPVISNLKEDFNFKVLRLKVPMRLGFSLNLLEPLILIIKERPRIVHFSGPAAVDFILIPFFKLLGYSVVLTFHGQFNNKFARALSKFIIPIAYKCADIIIVETERDQNYLINKQVDSHKIRKFVFDGVNKSTFNCQESHRDNCNQRENNPLRFIFIGGLSSSRPYKGYDLLVDMFVKLKYSPIFPIPELIIVGSGDRLIEIKQKCEGLNYIHFKGRLDDDEMIKELCNSDILILPSKTDGEGFGIAALEALSCNKPIMVSKYAGIAELTSKYNVGIVYDPWDVEKAIKTVNDINVNREILNVFRGNIENLFKIEDLSKDDSIKKTIEVYREVLASNSGIYK